jgi:hypothetical protein
MSIELLGGTAKELFLLSIGFLCGKSESNLKDTEYLKNLIIF